MDSLGQHIAAKRREARKTLRETARALDISPALLSLIEHDKQKPMKKTVCDLAAFLGGDADVWCGMLGQVTPSAEQQLSKIACEDPDFFRSMIRRFGKG